MAQDDTDLSVMEGALLGTGIMAVILAPVALGFALLRLSFRAPLAASFGAIFVCLLAYLGLTVVAAMTSGSNGFGGFVAAFFVLMAGAGACYGLCSANWMSAFFRWEASFLVASIRSGGVAGRIFYIFVQLVPGILLTGWAVFCSVAALDGTAKSEDWIVMLPVALYLAIWQWALLHFHRTAHPVGIWLTFAGHPNGREDDLVT